MIRKQGPMHAGFLMQVVDDLHVLQSEFNRLQRDETQHIQQHFTLTVMLAIIRSTFALFGIGRVPRCRAQLIATCAGVTL